MVIIYSLVSTELDALVFQDWIGFQVSDLNGLFKGWFCIAKNEKKKLTDTGFCWFFSELDFYKNLLDGGFLDLDGLISDQSTSDTKVVRPLSLGKSTTALFGVHRFYGGGIVN